MEVAIFSIKRSVNMQESVVEISAKNDSPETYISLAPKDAFLLAPRDVFIKPQGRVLTLRRTHPYHHKQTPKQRP